MSRKEQKEVYLSYNSGILELRCFEGGTGHTAWVEPMADGMGWYKGVDRVSDETRTSGGMYIDPTNYEGFGSRKLLHHRLKFDLSNPADKLILKWVLECDSVVALSDVSDVKGQTFYVYNQVIEEAKQVNKVLEKSKIISTVSNLDVAGLRMITRLLGQGMDNNTEGEIKTYLLVKLDSDPTGDLARKISLILNDPDNKMKHFVMNCVDAGVIVEKKGDYTWNERFLGGTIPSVIAYMRDRKNSDIVARISEEARVPFPKSTEFNEELIEDIKKGKK